MMQQYSLKLKIFNSNISIIWIYLVRDGKSLQGIIGSSSTSKNFSINDNSKVIVIGDKGIRRCIG